MNILATAVGRRKEAVASIAMKPGTGQFIINNKPAQEYFQNNSSYMLIVKAPFDVVLSNATQDIENNNNTTPDSPLNQGDTVSSTNMSLSGIDTIVKVGGGGLMGQAEAIRLGLSRAFCILSSVLTNADKVSTNLLENTKEKDIRKQLKDKGFLTQDSRVIERKKYGLKKARKASQFHKR